MRACGLRAEREDGGVAVGDGGGYTGIDDEFPHQLCVLLPDDRERPLSTLADSSLSTPLSSQHLILSDCGSHLYL
jgi:hypothetical protein